jgi:hypothetical protein
MKSDISKTTEIFMFVIAGFFDLLQFGVNFIPAVGQFISILITIFGWLTFFLWFQFHSISIFNGRNLFFGLLEFIPIVNDLPMFLALVFRTLAAHKEAQIIQSIPGGQIASTVIDKKMSGPRNTDGISINKNGGGAKIKNEQYETVNN